MRAKRAYYVSCLEVFYFSKHFKFPCHLTVDFVVAFLRLLSIRGLFTKPDFYLQGLQHGDFLTLPYVKTALG